MGIDDIHTRIAACVMFVFAPGALALVWLVRTPPRALECFEQSTAARDEVMERWLDGAGPLVAAGALLVLGTLVLVSRWRCAARGRKRAGRPTLWAASLGAAYSVLCAVQTGFFAVIAVPWILLLIFWPVSLPLLAAVLGIWIARRPRGERALASIQALGWCSLLVGIVGVGVMIAGPGIGDLCLD